MLRVERMKELVEGLEMPVSAPTELDDGMLEELGGETVGDGDILAIAKETAVLAE